MRPLFITRPQPAAQRTAAAARDLGLDPVVAPLLRIEPQDWSLPEGSFDALLLTSVNAVEHAGPKLRALSHLPAYAVGPATAAAARNVGLSIAAAGEAGGDAIVAQAASCARLLHLTGEDQTDLRVQDGVERVVRVVYRAVPVEPAPQLLRQLARGDVVIALFSPRTARLLVALAAKHALPRDSLAIAALSPNVAAAAGAGWWRIAVADRPNESSLLAAAAPLCEEGA